LKNEFVVDFHFLFAVKHNESRKCVKLDSVIIEKKVIQRFINHANLVKLKGLVHVETLQGRYHEAHSFLFLFLILLFCYFTNCTILIVQINLQSTSSLSTIAKIIMLNPSHFKLSANYLLFFNYYLLQTNHYIKICNYFQISSFQNFLLFF
jgi:hypothetical protein